MMTSNPYPDHASPVRAAREKARKKLPCSRCGSNGEPTIRRARPNSEEWHQHKDAYFGCPDCGLMLAKLTGAAAMRPSDVPSDHEPED